MNIRFLGASLIAALVAIGSFFAGVSLAMLVLPSVYSDIFLPALE